MTEKNIQNNYKEAIQLELALAFLRPADEQRKIERKRKKLAQTLTEIASGEIGNEAISALIILQDQDLQALGILAGGVADKKRCGFVKNRDRMAAALEFHWKQRVALFGRMIDKACAEDGSGEGKLGHARRRQGLGIAIKGLERAALEIENAALLEEARLELARALFQRGRIVRPKGFSVPGKKKELFQRALDQLAMAGDGSTAQALGLKAEIYLEWLRFFPGELPADLDEVLKQALPNATDGLKVAILLSLAERGHGSDYGHDLQCLVDDDRLKPLSRARAAAARENWSVCGAMVLEAIEQLELTPDGTHRGTPFFHEDWEHMVELLRRGWGKVDDWQDCCLMLWGLVVCLENNTSNGCHLRWYWSRQRDVYDLAFEAADDNRPLKARIADSLKSRPALHFSQLEKLAEEGGHKKLKEWIEDQEAGFHNRYIMKSLKPIPEAEVSLQNPWPALPAGWISVHLYLSRWPEKKGYALIQNGNSWAQRTFDYEKLWAAYLAWQAGYGKCPSHLEPTAKQKRLAPIVETLCRAIGKEMPWLFVQELFPVDQSVVFIPNDFLHRLPLHCALNPNPEPNKAQLFISLHKVLSLPAWWQADQTVPQQSHQPEGEELKDLFLVCWEGKTSDELTILIKNLPTSVSLKMPAESKDLLCARLPSLLVVYSHGKAQQNNPYESRLLLKDGGPTVGEILGRKELSLSGSDVILGACESDLMLPLSSTIDEHITLSSVFLGKGAKAVSGALWRIGETADIQFFGPCLQDRRNMYDQWLEWVDEKVSVYEGNPENYQELLFQVAAIRIVGRPREQGDLD